MLRLALVFLIIALIAAALGAGGAAYVATEIAWLLFVVFLALFCISIVAGALRSSPPV
jgi:uncharacterized membrane protein YtjA (UPF0391 family)